jgi:hypothetical protein
MPTAAIMRRLSTETFLSTRFILDSSPLAAPRRMCFPRREHFHLKFVVVTILSHTVFAGSDHAG